MSVIASRLHDMFMRWFLDAVLDFYGRTSAATAAWLEDITERFPDDHGA